MSATATNRPTPLRQLLADPQRWTQCTAARNGRSMPVPPSDPEACCWCLSAAIAQAYPDPRADLGTRARLADVIRRRWPERLGDLNLDATPLAVILAWNDHRLTSHADVLALLEEAQL